MLRKVLYGLLGVLVFALVLVVVGPGLIDWTPYRDRIAAQARDMLGRDVTIDGNASLTLLPAPALSAGKVRIANIEGGSEPAMAEIEALKIRLALLPLFQFRIQVESVVLVEPKILLEVLPDGRRNWVLGQDAAAAAAGTGPGERGGRAFGSDAELPSEIRIDSFTIDNGTLVYRDATKGFERRIERLDAEIAAESLAGPIRAQGRALVGGLETEFDFGLGRLVQAGATSLNVLVRLAEAEAQLKFDGSLSVHPDTLRMRGKLMGGGGNLATVVRAFVPNSSALPAVLGQSFSLETEVSGDLAQITGSRLALTLGDIVMNGDAGLKLGPPLDFGLSLGATRIDLDRLLAGGVSDPAAAAGQEPAPEEVAAEDAESSALPTGLKARLELEVQGMIYRGQAIRQVRLDAVLNGGRLTLGEAKAQLPGGSELSLAGGLESPGGRLGYDGHLDLTSDNLRVLATWLGADLRSVPPQRLRRVELTSRFEGDQHQLTLKDLDLKIDLTRVTGGIVAALRERVGLGIGLAVDTLNLDAYLPDAQAPAPVPTPGALGQQAGAEDEGEGEGEGDEKQGALGFLDAFDANIDLRVGNLIVKGETARNLRVDATLQSGTLSLREVSAADYAGGQGSFAGVIAGLSSAPTLDGTLKLEVSDPLRFAKAGGLDEALLARLGPFGVIGSVKGTMAEIAVDSELSALGGRFGFAGTLRPDDAPLGFDLAVTARHPDLAGLAGAWDSMIDLGPGLGGLVLQGRAVGTTQHLEISDLKGVLGPFSLAGNLAADLSRASLALSDLDLAVELTHADFAQLVEGFAGPLALNRDLGDVALEARLTGTNRRPALAGLAGNVGPVEVSDGMLDLDLAGTKPVLNASLATGELPLAVLFAPAAGAGAATEADESSGDRWSADPIDLSGLAAFDGRLNLTAAALVGERLRLEDAEVVAALEDGVLAIDRLAGKLHGGSFVLSGTLATKGALEADLQLSARGVAAQPLLIDWIGFDRISGPVDLTAELTSAGSSEAQLVAALDGRGELTGTLAVEAGAKDPDGAPELGLMGLKGEVRGVADAAGLLFSDLAAAPVRLRGSFIVEKGAILTEDLSLEGQEARVLTRGTARLPAWKLKTRSDLFRDAKAEEAYLSVTLDGPLDAPDVALAGLALRPPVPKAKPGPEVFPQPEPDTAALPPSSLEMAPADETAPEADAGPEPKLSPGPEIAPETVPEVGVAPETEIPEQPETVPPEPAPSVETELGLKAVPEIEATPGVVLEPLPTIEVGPAPGAFTTAPPEELPVEPETLAQPALEPEPEPEAQPEPAAAPEEEEENEFDPENLIRGLLEGLGG